MGRTTKKVKTEKEQSSFAPEEIEANRNQSNWMHSLLLLLHFKDVSFRFGRQMTIEIRNDLNKIDSCLVRFSPECNWHNCSHNKRRSEAKWNKKYWRIYQKGYCHRQDEYVIATHRPSNIDAFNSHIATKYSYSMSMQCKNSTFTQSCSWCMRACRDDVFSESHMMRLQSSHHQIGLIIRQ